MTRTETEQEMTSLIALRARLKEGIDLALRHDGAVLGNEGVVKVLLPPLLEGSETPYRIVVHPVSVLGPERPHRFEGKTLGEAVMKARVAVEEWIADLFLELIE